MLQSMFLVKFIKEKTFGTDEGQRHLGKGVVGIGLIGPGSYNGTTSEYEAAKRTCYNQGQSDGSIQAITLMDLEEMLPMIHSLNYTRIIAQALAHRSLDGQVPDPLKEERFFKL